MSSPPKRSPKWPPKEEDVLPLMQPHEREVFLSLDPEIRRFLLSANEKEREVFLALPPLEMFRFPRLSPEQRAAYLRLAPQEKSLLTKLGDDDWKKYLSLKPEERKPFATSTAAGKAQAQHTQQVQLAAAAMTKSLEDAYQPWTEGAEARTRVVSAIYSALAAGSSQEQAWSIGVRALLSDSQVQEKLVSELKAKTTPDQAQRTRPFLPQLIERHSAQEGREAFVDAIAAEVKSGKLDAAREGAAKAADLASSLQKALKGRGFSG